MNTQNNPDFLVLKWGTLKAWNLSSPECRKLMDEYIATGVCASAALQHNTPEQKEIICKIIDECGAMEICLDWEDKMVSKDDAKKYVREYGNDKANEPQ